MKRYGALFTCLVSRAVHIEVASSLESSSFIQALRRFIARRGPVREIRTDNGTNFVGARNELLRFIYFILLASPTGRDTATACANYCGPGTRSQFCGARKPECPEKTLEVRLRLTETQSTYNILVEVEGVIDVHYASLTSQGVQHRVFYIDGHPSRYQPRPTGLNFGEQTGAGVFPLVIAVPHISRP